MNGKQMNHEGEKGKEVKGAEVWQHRVQKYDNMAIQLNAFLIEV